MQQTNSFFSADWPAPAQVKTCITTRQGGVSLAPWASLNLATHVGDKQKHVLQNRKLLTQRLPQDPVWLNQQHSNIITPISLHSSSQPAKSPIADASFTQDEQTVCAVLTADCLPILICSEDGKIVAAIHAGWKGLANGIIESSIQQLILSSRLKAQQFLVWLGPAISQPAFEVGAEVREEFIRKQPLLEKAFIASSHGNNKYLADLYHIAKILLMQLNIFNIYGGNFCTYNDKNRFFSYRRNGVTGRIASMIWINSDTQK